MEDLRIRRNVILPLVYMMAPLTSAVSTLVDGATKVRDFAGQWTWVTTSNYTGTFTYAYIALLLGVALLTIIKDLASEKRLASMPYLVISVPVLLASLYALRSDFASAISVVFAVVVLAAVAISGISTADVRLLGHLAIGTAFAAFAFLVVNPERALVPCRIDKCSALDGLLTSFFPQENVLAIFMIMSLGAVMFGLQGFPRGIGAIMLITLIGLSGSRTVTMAAIVICILSLIFLRTKNPRVLGPVYLISAGAAGALFVTSAVLFFIPLDTLAFTGRGFIYDLLRSYWQDQPIIGPGRVVLEQAFNIGISANYAISHEHGGLPYVIVNGGLLLMMFFFYWLFQLLRVNGGGSKSWVKGLCLVFAVTVGIVSITEPVWTYDLRSPAFWTLALVSCALVPHVRAHATSYKSIEVRESQF